MAKKIMKLCIDCQNEFYDCWCWWISKIRCEACLKKLQISLLTPEQQDKIIKTEESQKELLLKQQYENDRELEYIKAQRAALKSKTK